MSDTEDASSAIDLSDTTVNPSDKQPASAPSAQQPGDPTLFALSFAPLHIKGLTTSVPANSNARKQTRLAEVRAKRVAAKENKRAIRLGLVKKHGFRGGEFKKPRDGKGARKGVGNVKGTVAETAK
jgi:hypothetical protein